mmetsp:Transcript_1290/g.2968  ORF Transcript_1290/g.2968 Transcript_1290/m.2968 type:complete len:105 (-) Transcript_1290:93-407(-)
MILPELVLTTMTVLSRPRTLRMKVANEAPSREVENSRTSRDRGRLSQRVTTARCERMGGDVSRLAALSSTIREEQRVREASSSEEPTEGSRCGALASSAVSMSS